MEGKFKMKDIWALLRALMGAPQSWVLLIGLLSIAVAIVAVLLDERDWLVCSFAIAMITGVGLILFETIKSNGD